MTNEITVASVGWIKTRGAAPTPLTAGLVVRVGFAALSPPYICFLSHTLLSWNAAPPNGAIASAPVSVLMPRPSA